MARYLTAASLLLSVLIVAIAPNAAIADSEYSLVVDARDNTAREPVTVSVGLPAGAVHLTIAAAGSACWAPDNLFGSVIVEHKEGASTVLHDIPIGGNITVDIADAIGYPLQFFFADTNPADNFGSVTISVSGTISATFAVSASSNCEPTVYAASLLIPEGPCTIQASGTPSFGWGSFAGLALLYDGADSKRWLRAVSVGAVPAPLPLFIGGEVQAFFYDAGGTFDNTGTALLQFSCVSVVSVEARSWSGLKDQYR